jgi:hypothetical protein
VTPRDFVSALKHSVRRDVATTVEYLARPPVSDAPVHLGEFGRWFQGLTEGQRATAAKLMEFVAEGSLFGLLNVLDNVVTLGDQPGRLELLHIEGDSQTVLNDSDGDLLYDLFNELP